MSSDRRGAEVHGCALAALWQRRDDLTAPVRGGREHAVVADEVGTRWRDQRCEAAQQLGGLQQQHQRQRWRR
jgi:hypothetical protein